MVRVPTNRITTHPGVLLREQIRELGLSVSGVARDISLPTTRLRTTRCECRDSNRAGCVFRSDPRILDERADGL